MADSYIGEIRPFAFNFAPYGWAMCNGQSLSTAQYSGLFAVIGYTYGGSGGSFRLPDLQGRVPVHRDDTDYIVGKNDGSATVTITAATMGVHGHDLVAANVKGTQELPGNGATPPITTSMLAIGYGTTGPSNTRVKPMYADPTEHVAMSATAVGAAYGTPTGPLAHDNTQPSLVLNFCINFDGAYPVRQ